MLSIIIPVLNEAATITNLLDHLKQHAQTEHVDEVIVVDGGSTDNSVALVRTYIENTEGLKFTLLESEKGRAKQMNFGAKLATGDILYFLHADSFPPAGFDSKIVSAVNNGKIAGCFRMKFDTKHPILTLSQWFTRFNLKACRGGDQSLFIKKKAFENLGGYNEDYTIYEDCEFISRIYDKYKFKVIDDYVITSARRYQDNGTLRLQYHFAMIHLKKWTGASPSELNRYYLKHIVS